MTRSQVFHLEDDREPSQPFAFPGTQFIGNLWRGGNKSARGIVTDGQAEYVPQKKCEVDILGFID